MQNFGKIIFKIDRVLEEKNIKEYQKGDTDTNHQYLGIRFKNDRLVILVETKNKNKDWMIFTHICKMI